MTNQADSPRALIHKRILGVAENRPQATVEDLADEISGASQQLVERVLNEYGDPGEDGEIKNSETEAAMSNNETPIDFDQLTDEQRRTVEAIAERPDATQREIAEELGVAAATVSQRLSAIDGFDWNNRGRVIAHTFEVGGANSSEPDQADDEETDQVATETTQNQPEGEVDDQISEDEVTSQERSEQTPVEANWVSNIENQIDALEKRLTEIESVIETKTAELESEIQETVTDGGKSSTTAVFEDTNLQAKVIRAAMADDAITDEEEIKIIEQLK